MNGLVGIIAFLTVLGLSLVITRIATIALSLTGLSHEAASFQARSAFTGTGFTTREAEKVVDHPVRRKIITLLMIARSAGLVTIVISLILSFAGTGGELDRFLRLLWLVVGVTGLWLMARSRIINRYLTRVIEWALKHWTDLDIRDYVSLLKLSGQYKVTELRIREGEWLSGKQLNQCRLTDEGVTVLGIYREDGTYIGVPRKDTEIQTGDTLVLYGRAGVLKDLDKRRADDSGERAHQEAVGDQKREESEQERREEESRKKKQSSPPDKDERAIKKNS